MICITSGCSVGFGAGAASPFSTDSDMSFPRVLNPRPSVTVRKGSHRSRWRGPIFARRLFHGVAQD